jgi:RNA polymerase sigma-70 factor (ECF subfamily)
MLTLSAAREGGASDTVPDDVTLVHAARADRAAFAPLYERYRDRVYAYLRARTPSAEDASDLMQQVFVRALAALPQYRGHHETVAAWLFRIARNAAVDFHRRRRDTIAWDLVPEALQPQSGQDLEAQVLREEAVARLRALLMGLNQDTRELLALRFAARLTVAETAAVLGKSEAAIKKQLVRTIRTLKERYDDQTR